MVKKVKKTSFLSKLFSKILLCIIFFLLVLIFLKSSPSFSKNLYKYVFEKHFSFAKVNETYEKWFGSSLPFSSIKSEAALVSSNKLEYNDSKVYKDGVELSVSNNYLPAIKNGIVIFKGNKKDYGNTVIIQQADGIELWYSNIKNIKVDMYDYVKKGDILGEVGEKVYLVFTKDGKKLDYKKYI